MPAQLPRRIPVSNFPSHPASDDAPLSSAQHSTAHHRPQHPLSLRGNTAPRTPSTCCGSDRHTRWPCSQANSPQTTYSESRVPMQSQSPLETGVVSHSTDPAMGVVHDNAADAGLISDPNQGCLWRYSHLPWRCCAGIAGGPRRTLFAL